MFYVKHIKSSLISGRSIPHEYIAFSSVKLQIPLMNISNNSGPNIEPHGILRQISDHFLYEEPTLVLCFLRLR